METNACQKQYSKEIRWYTVNPFLDAAACDKKTQKTSVALESELHNTTSPESASNPEHFTSTSETGD